MEWVDGKPRLKSERYLGSAADIAAAVADAERAVAPQRTRHLAFGDVAAAWGITQRLDLARIIDEVVGPRRADAGASVGTYLALAAINRLVDPCSRQAFADWWTTTAAERFTKIRASVLEHRRFWDALHTVTETHLVENERRDLHRHRQRQGRPGPARQSQAKTLRSTVGRPRPGRHPRRRYPAGLTRLLRQPARCHPVRHRP